MFTNSRLVYCVMIAAFIGMSRMDALAQDLFEGVEANPFEGVEADPAAVQPAADPATAAAEALSATKSLLAGELPDTDAAAGQSFCRCIGESDSAAMARIENALRGPLAATGLDVVETPLVEVVNLLQDEYGIPIQIDGAALESAGSDPSEQVTVNIHNVSLRSALRLMLKTIQLTYVIQDEVLIITTPEEADARLLTCVYNVRGFMPDTSTRSTDALIDTIVSCVATESWAENGGGESEIKVPRPGLLVISQTQVVHEEISSLLNAIREMGNTRDAAGDAADATSPADEEQVVTRAYKLQIKQADDGEQLRKQVRELIVQSFPDEQWDGRLADGQPVMLTVLGDRIIVRHKPTVQDAVEEILTDSRVAMTNDFCGGSERGRGGTDGDAPDRFGSEASKTLPQAAR